MATIKTLKKNVILILISSIKHDQGLLLIY